MSTDLKKYLHFVCHYRMRGHLSRGRYPPSESRLSRPPAGQNQHFLPLQGSKQRPWWCPFWANR